MQEIHCIYKIMWSSWLTAFPVDWSDKCKSIQFTHCVHLSQMCFPLGTEISTPFSVSNHLNTYSMLCVILTRSNRCCLNKACATTMLSVARLPNANVRSGQLTQKLMYIIVPNSVIVQWAVTVSYNDVLISVTKSISYVLLVLLNIFTMCVSDVCYPMCACMV